MQVHTAGSKNHHFFMKTKIKKKMVKYKYFSLVNNSFKKMNKHTKIEKKKS